MIIKGGGKGLVLKIYFRIVGAPKVRSFWDLALMQSVMIVAGWARYLKEAACVLQALFITSNL
jgi:hypothetical protein